MILQLIVLADGHWLHDRYFPAPRYYDGIQRAHTPFEGFRFRRSQDLGLNWFSIEHYVTGDPQDHQGWVDYDQVVVAQSRVGCIKP